MIEKTFTRNNDISQQAGDDNLMRFLALDVWRNLQIDVKTKSENIFGICRILIFNLHH